MMKNRFFFWYFRMFGSKAYVFRPQISGGGKFEIMANVGTIIGFCCGDTFKILTFDGEIVIEFKDVQIKEGAMGGSVQGKILKFNSTNRTKHCFGRCGASDQGDGTEGGIDW